MITSEDLARLVQDRRRADGRPAVVARGRMPVTDDGFLRRSLRERAAGSGAASTGSGVAVLADELEPLEQLCAGGASISSARVEPTQPRRGVVA